MVNLKILPYNDFYEDEIVNLISVAYEVHYTLFLYAEKQSIYRIMAFK